MSRVVCVTAIVALIAACGPNSATDDGVGDREGEIAYTCQDPGWTAGACEAPEITEQPDQGGQHVPLDEAITYEFSPPASGPHRGQWARWGEYAYLPPQRWVHNLEHGGVAILYNPCADQDTIDALHTYASARPDDDGGRFRWVLTPYPGLGSAIAVVIWGWVFEAECVDPDAIEAFVAAHYRKAPEDVPSDGAYANDFLGR